nr:hypothetical protein TetV2_00561 [Oceanusvirus sp.]
MPPKSKTSSGKKKSSSGSSSSGKKKSSKSSPSSKSSGGPIAAAAAATSAAVGKFGSGGMFTVIIVALIAFCLGYIAYRMFFLTPPPPPAIAPAYNGMEVVLPPSKPVNSSFTQCPVEMSFYYSNGEYYAEYRRHDGSAEGVEKGNDAHGVVVAAIRASTTSDDEAASCAVKYKSSVKDACGVDTSTPGFLKEVCNGGNHAYELANTGELAAPGFNTAIGHAL